MKKGGKKKKPRRLKPWRDLSLVRKVLRIAWVTAAVAWAVSVVQVAVGRFVDPPLTPLMVQRHVQQLFDSEREVVFEHRSIPLDSVSANLVTAVVYAEDGLFLYHHGFDVKQMKRAKQENRKGGRIRGGSTISQQTAKNAFLPHSRTMLRKALEAYYTVMIETVWGKRRIMEVYLNIAEFGDGIYGVEAASQHYFGHPAAKLSRREAALLAATLPSPLKRNPGHPTPAFERYAGKIEQRFSWGLVDIDNPDPKLKERYKDNESLIDFIIWYRDQEKE